MKIKTGQLHREEESEEWINDLYKGFKIGEINPEEEDDGK